MLSVKPYHKLVALKYVRQLEGQIAALLVHPKPTTVADGRALLLKELQALTVRLQGNGSTLGGEGVEDGPPAVDRDELPPQSENPKCVLQEEVASNSNSQTDTVTGDAIQGQAFKANSEIPAAGGGESTSGAVKSLVGGKEWPMEARVKITGFCNNNRLCVGRIVGEDGRLGEVVSVWKGRLHYRTDVVLACRLDLVQGDDARYLPV